MVISKHQKGINEDHKNKNRDLLHIKEKNEPISKASYELTRIPSYYSLYKQDPKKYYERVEKYSIRKLLEISEESLPCNEW